jgi:transposase
MSKINQKAIQVRLSTNRLRSFSVEFKKNKVKELSKGLISIDQIVKLYEVSRTSVYNWIHLYSTTPIGVRTVIQMDSEQSKTAQLLKRVAELERNVGQKQLEIEYLNKLIELMGNELNIDLKKKAEQLRSNGSDCVQN